MSADAKRLSVVLSRVFLAALTALPVALVLLIWNLEWVIRHPGVVTILPAPILAEGLPLPAAFSLQARLAVAGAWLLPAGLTAVILWNLARFFAGLGRGEVFTAEGVRRLHRVGLCLLARVCAAPLVESLTTLGLTLDNPPGQHVITVSLSSSDLTQLVTALTLLVAARVLDQARELHDEAQLTI